ncbi:hypothetical protein CBR_g30877 [Chara braunii]|uniref:Uncharacterized protein n=1 Tax=Chara braunii TaxID=69332 RepID=A0A388LDX5_CHABU|nr:hypothetical protein CBR_g30877 [Chara braunii]|eukprot:GBG80412.1 hypothetical protein CBR_g30877 [Chara braunii]
MVLTRSKTSGMDQQPGETTEAYEARMLDMVAEFKQQAVVATSDVRRKMRTQRNSVASLNSSDRRTLRQQGRLQTNAVDYAETKSSNARGTPSTFETQKGYLGLHMRINAGGATFSGAVEGNISFVVWSLPGPGETEKRCCPVSARLKVKVIPTPPREKRLLWDQFHSVQYPPGYIPRDSLDVRHDILDWHGDHVHTNYHEMFDMLYDEGYFVEVLGSPFTCFDANLRSQASWKEQAAIDELRCCELGVAQGGPWVHVASVCWGTRFDWSSQSPSGHMVRISMAGGSYIESVQRPAQGPQPGVMKGPRQSQWVPKTAIVAPKPFTADKRGEDLDTWLRAVPVYVKCKLTLPDEEVLVAASYLEGSAARWLSGLVQLQGYGHDFRAWAAHQKLDDFLKMVEDRWHDPQGSQKATDAILALQTRQFKSGREATDAVERLICVPGVRYDPQVLLTSYLRCVPMPLRNQLAGEANINMHNFPSFSKKDIDLEAKIWHGHNPTTDGRKKTLPLNWKAKGRIMFVDNDGSTIELDDNFQEGVGSEAGNVKASGGVVVAAVAQKDLLVGLLCGHKAPCSTVPEDAYEAARQYQRMRSRFFDAPSSSTEQAYEAARQYQRMQSCFSDAPSSLRPAIATLSRGITRGRSSFIGRFQRPSQLGAPFSRLYSSLEYGDDSTTKIDPSLGDAPEDLVLRDVIQYHLDDETVPMANCLHMTMSAMGRLAIVLHRLPPAHSLFLR